LGGFGIGGRMLGDPFPSVLITDAVALPDEKLIVAGSSGQDMVVARCDADGKRDPGFGLDGIVRIGVGLQTPGFDIALQPDGQLVLYPDG
jgi:hypothetical protein